MVESYRKKEDNRVYLQNKSYQICAEMGCLPI